MDLQYLDFDFSDDDDGQGSFDALASVPAARLPALCAEVDAVLAWAHARHGSPGALDDGAGWDWTLQASEEPDTPLQPHWQPGQGLQLRGGSGTGRTTVAFTVVGSPAFCEALRGQFGLDA